MWKPENVQPGKGSTLLVTKEMFCDIANFVEPGDVVNIAGYWRVEFQMAKKGKKNCTRGRRFKSKTYADQYVALIKSTTAAFISGPTFHKDIQGGLPEGLKMVTPDGKVSVKEYMDIKSVGL